MIKLYNFDNVEIVPQYYGGRSGKKFGILFNGENYMLKLPKNLKERDLKNVTLSYSNSAISEFLGSHIYEIIGIPVHKTILGYYKEKLVVACKDFRDTESGEELRLQHFSSVKNATPIEPLDSNGNISASPFDSTDLVEIYNTLREYAETQQYPEIMDRFWNMFVIDAFIGNADRNNDNWGLLTHKNKVVGLAPVYDNGNALNDKWDEQKMLRCLSSPQFMTSAAYKGVVSIFKLKDKLVNPYKIMQAQEFPECTDAILRIVPQLDMGKITELFEDAYNSGIIGKIQRDFYIKLMSIRYNDMLLPLYQKLAKEREDQQQNYYYGGLEL